MSFQTKVITHRQAVLKLYKAAVKNEKNWFPNRYFILFF